MLTIVSENVNFNNDFDRYNKIRNAMATNFEIVKEEILKERNDERMIDNCGYYELFQEALIMNKCEIVNLFLENEINLNEFLNNSFHLFSLYENVFNRPIHLYLQNKYKESDIFIRVVNKPNYLDWDAVSSKTKFIIIEKTYLKSFLNDLFPNLKISHLLFPKRLFQVNLISGEILIDNPEMYLFYWCILTNRLETAKIFWKIGKVKTNYLMLTF